MIISTYNSPITKLWIARENDKIIAISFSELDEDYLKKLADLPSVSLSGKINSTIDMWLDTYFKGKDPDFSVHIDLHGTAFQKSVWLACARIPYAETRSYGELAEMIGNPKAIRAVGSALGANPIPLIIPCHRVINSNGKLGGFAGGLDVKKALLELEK
jgi:O-6-methylguanine DNA methyltransferase